MNFREIKPGWYVLILLLLYCALTTFAWQRSERLVRAFRASAGSPATVRASATIAAPRASARSQTETLPDVLSATVAPEPQLTALPAEGLWLPVPGAHIPQDDIYLPGAVKPQQRGKSQGFVFYGDNAGVPIVYGTPVIASADAVIVRADDLYESPDEATWASLMSALTEREPSEEERDILRGRQIWLRTDDGRSLRYGHLAGVREGLLPGERVYRGEVIGFIGNSGTHDGVAGSTRGARLHYEIWNPNNTYFGQNFASGEALRRAAELIFTGP